VQVYLRIHEYGNQKSAFISLKKFQEAATGARFLVACHMTKHNKPLLDIEFVKQCMLDAREAACFPL
jgi:hypothetical protein